MSKRERRLEEITELVQSKGRISVQELASVFQVTDLTIRRDVKVLEAEGAVQNVRGIVFSREDRHANLPYSLTLAGTMNLERKNAIGKYAAAMLQPGDIVLIDNGTTTERMAAYIPDDLPVTALCYNINILNSLYTKQNITLMFGGGIFHKETLMFEGKESIEMIRRTRATKAFVSCAGVHDRLGVTCSTTYELESKNEIMKASQEKILLVDSSKFGQIHKNYICELSSFDTIVTDRYISEEWKQIVRDADVELITV